MTHTIYKYPRLYLNAPLRRGMQISLEPDHVHYLKNVLRKASGDSVRVFNGRDGEWLGQIEKLKKSQATVMLDRLLHEQPSVPVSLGLYFAPIKKQRMDFLIEKAVELGATDLYPVITNRTESRMLNTERLKAQITEAAEQCERMEVPVLHKACRLADIIGIPQTIPLYACLERHGGLRPEHCDFSDGAAFLIGPEGGFDSEEIQLLTGSARIKALSLGETILRSETAALACLAYVKLSTVAR